MNISQLRYLQAVARYGSVREAARCSHVTPQAISIAISRLEKELGRELLGKTSGGVALTAFGRAYLDRADRVLDAVADLESLAVSSGAQPCELGHFRMYAPRLNGRGDLFTDGMYARFCEQHPDIHLDVWAAQESSLEDALLRGLCDTAITLHKSCSPNLECREIGSLPLIMLGDKDSDVCNRGVVNAEDLMSHHIAMPVCLAVCSDVMSRFLGLDMARLALRDTGYDYRDQADFLREGGLILALENSPLEQACDRVRAVSFFGPHLPCVPVFLLSRKGEWTDRHQAAYWFTLNSLSTAMRR